ncbi:MAG TPA: branched-chain amino acid ABC transporter permease [Candidatus Limnocylindrales bacterium]|jgi:branched-chain amino acid transport system permease protein|nr:branched-chain amino acid ABC transporter permease [Candidatus Limnocylindrales bacterium]
MSGIDDPRIIEAARREAPRSGVLGWLANILDAITGIPGKWRESFRRGPVRTVALTVLLGLGVAYPILALYVLAPFSRNVFPLPLAGDTDLVFMLIFATMAIGLNVVIGFAGLLDLGYVAFYALGAYTAAFLASPHWSGLSFVLLSDVPPGFPGIHIAFWFILPLAAIVAAFWGALLGAPTLRLRGDYLAIVTLGFGEIVPVIFKNLVGVNFELGPIKLVDANLTGGPLGINPIDPPNLFGIKFGAVGGVAPVYLAMVIVFVSLLIARNLEHSRMGRAWAAIREDETAAEMMGVNTVRTKLLAFALGASFAGLAGSLQASYQGATTSDFFQFSTSILVVIMIILGGIGNIYGALVGALALVYVDKVLLAWIGQRMQGFGRSIDNDAIAHLNPASFNFLIFGIVLVAMMRFRPEGLIPNRQRTAELHEAPPDQAIGSAAVLGEAAIASEAQAEAIAEEVASEQGSASQPDAPPRDPDGAGP